MTGEELYAAWRVSVWDSSVTETETWAELEPWERAAWDDLAEKVVPWEE